MMLGWTMLITITIVCALIISLVFSMISKGSRDSKPFPFLKFFGFTALSLVGLLTVTIMSLEYMRKENETDYATQAAQMRRSNELTEMGKIVVSSRKIRAGEKIASDALVERELSIDRISVFSFESKKDLVGRVARTPINAGKIILADNLVDDGLNQDRVLEDVNFQSIVTDEADESDESDDQPEAESDRNGSHSNP
ncbi:MAG TPA: SAF domain-containing protein [Candidatus Obscuribacterales bacterium]